MSKKLKVFHGLLNYGTQAGLFAESLRNRGIDAISVVNPDPSKRQTDVELLYSSNSSNSLHRKIKQSWNFTRKIYWFFKYNTFHFYFGRTLLPYQRDLPFYKLFGKKVVMEYLGNDVRNYRQLVERYELPKNHDYVKNMEEHDKRVAKRISNEKQYLDYTLCCLPSHMDFAQEYGLDINEILPLSLNISEVPYIPKAESEKLDDKVIILHAPTNRVFKGTAYIEEAIGSLKREGYNIEFRLIEGVTHKELFKEYITCDIFIDQISVGWYGTASLESMAVGRPTCAFIDERYFKYIDYADQIPVININKLNVKEKVRNLIENRNTLFEIGEKSRAFVERFHSVEVQTEKLISIYKKLHNQ